MLELKNISKVYITEAFKQNALDGVSIKFRKSELGKENKQIFNQKI